MFASWLSLLYTSGDLLTVHHNEHISVSSIADRKRTCYVHRHPLERCAGIMLLQLTSSSSYWTFSCNTLGTVSYIICDCLLSSNLIKSLFYLFQHLCPTVAPLWNSFNTSFILEEATTTKLDEVLRSALSQCRYKHPFISIKLFHSAQYTFVRDPLP